jgi:hypothetical protein
MNDQQREAARKERLARLIAWLDARRVPKIPPRGGPFSSRAKRLYR